LSMPTTFESNPSTYTSGLLHDAMVGDATPVFQRATWWGGPLARGPVQSGFMEGPPAPPVIFPNIYAAGPWGPKDAEELLDAKTGGPHWRNFSIRSLSCSTGRVAGG